MDNTKDQKLKLIVDNAPRVFESLLSQDFWSFSELNYSTEELETTSQNTIDFTRFKIGWLKILAKETLIRKRNQVRPMTLQRYVILLRRFDDFLNQDQFSSVVSAHYLERSVMQLFIVSMQDLAKSSQQSYLASMREVLASWNRWGFIDINPMQLIHKDDIPRARKSKPRFLNNDSQTKLSKASKEVANETLYSVLALLLEVGMRGSEALNLKKDCLSTDNEGDWYISRHCHKTDKHHTVPISADLAKLIKQQLQRTQALEKYFFGKSEQSQAYLFIRKNKGNIGPYSLRHFNRFLKGVGIDLNIKDDSGTQTQLSSHVFRHTVGTNLINNGMSQLFVQRFLGHDSAEMTAVYATIHDQTLKHEIQTAQHKLIDIQGSLYDLTEVMSDADESYSNDADWLKKQLSAQALPNGICALPIKQKCPHANACLTCSSFRTDERFLDIHTEHLNRCNTIIDQAKLDANVFARQLELNQQTATTLTKIIETLTHD